LKKKTKIKYQCCLSCYFSEASPTKSVVKILHAKHPQKSTSAQLKSLHESSSSDTCKLLAKIPATAVTTGATVKKAGSEESSSEEVSKTATSQPKTVAPTATPKAVSASKSVTPKVAKKSHNQRVSGWLDIK